MLVTLWAGLALAEGVLELGASDDKLRALVARQHFQLDVFLEAPLLLGVLTTGAALLVRSWPPSPLLASKMVAGLLTVAANTACIVAVVQRHRHAEDPVALRVWSHRVRVSALAAPFFIFAAAMGLTYFRR